MSTLLEFVMSSNHKINWLGYLYNILIVSIFVNHKLLHFMADNAVKQHLYYLLLKRLCGSQSTKLFLW